MIDFNDDKQEERIKTLLRKEAEDSAELLSGKYGIAYGNLLTAPVNSDALRLVPEAEAREAKMAVFDISGKKLKVAVLSPQFDKTLLVLKKLETAGYALTLFMVSATSLEKAWSLYATLSYASESKAGALDISAEEVASVMKDVKNLNDITSKIYELLKGTKGFKISKILEVILAGALAINASDIHIEPEEEYVRIRFRLDGVLTDVIKFDRQTYRLLLSRIKLISGLKLNVGSEAQDGRFSVGVSDADIEIRTSVLPGAYAESIVMRVLNPKSISVPLEQLGMSEKLLELVNKTISKPNGMLLTTGPTGSGKTTTLYALLRKLHDPSIKIITIEDPIEYHLPGIVQTQTDSEKGYTFLSGLRSALRQDPDVIMVGEIRDSETASVAINSALTGHLVFSTLHTNNAAGTFTRLIDLKVNPKIITSALSLAMAQRLVRKLCQACKKEAPIEPADQELFKKILSELKDPLPPIEKMFVPVGCAVCNNTGYKGRAGVYEAIITDQAIEKVVEASPSEREIKKASVAQNIPDMRQDGIMKILAGLTSLEEVKRVIDLEAEM
ncbi:MAG: GspE/PulE family protein [Candidatus Paceibacterota bacterium]